MAVMMLDFAPESLTAVATDSMSGSVAIVPCTPEATLMPTLPAMAGRLQHGCRGVHQQLQGREPLLSVDH